MSMGGMGLALPLPVLSMNFFRSVLRYSKTCSSTPCASSLRCRSAIFLCKKHCACVLPGISRTCCAPPHVLHKATCIQACNLQCCSGVKRFARLFACLLDDVIALAEHLQQRYFTQSCGRYSLLLHLNGSAPGDGST